MNFNSFIPLFDLNKQYLSIKDEVDRVLISVAKSGQFILGKEVVAFEHEFAEYQRTRHCVGTSSGTSALYLALLGIGIGFGDEVITVPNSFVATGESIVMSGAEIVFTDIDPDTYSMDPNRLEAVITKKTKAIMPVHLYGQMADMDSIIEIAEKYDLAIIEDAAQAHGAEYNGKRAGEMTTCACFSFYPTKNLGAFGDAGAIVTNDEKIAEKLRFIRDHGRNSPDHSVLQGVNERLDSIQAAVLRVKLTYLEKWNDRRRELSRLLSRYLGDVSEVTVPKERAIDTHVYHLYVIQADSRDQLTKYLREHGIGTGIHYKNPIHLQKAYAGYSDRPGRFPVTEKLSHRILTLPMYPELKKSDVTKIAESIKIFYAKKS